METRTYAVEKTDLQALGQRTGNWMEEQGLEMQILQEGKNLITIQGRRQSLARFVLGTCYALTVKLSATTEGFEATVGAGEWFSKAAAASVTVLTFLRAEIPTMWPTLATAGYGILRQQQLLKGTWRIIEDYVEEATGKRRKVSVPIAFTCDACGTVNPNDHAFCVKCGRRLPGTAPAVPHCAACGQVLPSDAEFCPRCGKAVEKSAPTPSSE